MKQVNYAINPAIRRKKSDPAELDAQQNPLEAVNSPPKSRKRSSTDVATSSPSAEKSAKNEEDNNRGMKLRKRGAQPKEGATEFVVSDDEADDDNDEEEEEEDEDEDDGDSVDESMKKNEENTPSNSSRRGARTRRTKVAEAVSDVKPAETRTRNLIMSYLLIILFFVLVCYVNLVICLWASISIRDYTATGPFLRPHIRDYSEAIADPEWIMEKLHVLGEPVLLRYKKTISVSLFISLLNYILLLCLRCETNLAYVGIFSAAQVSAARRISSSLPTG